MMTRVRSRRYRYRKAFLVLALTIGTVVASIGVLDMTENDAFSASRGGYVWAPFGEGIPGSSRALREMHVQP